MIYLYDKSLAKHLKVYFENVICTDEDDAIDSSTKRLSILYKKVGLPYISIKRSVEYTSVSDNGGMVFKALHQSPIRINSTYKYNESGKIEARKNGVIGDNIGYNYSIMPVPIDLTYTLYIVGDSKESVDNTFCDLMFILHTQSQIKLDEVFSEKLTNEDVKTFIEVLSANYEAYRNKEAGVRYSYSIEIKLTGAKIYFTSKNKVVIQAPVDERGVKKGGN